MLDAGVDYAILVPLGREPAYVMRWRKREPARFAALAVLGPESDPPATCDGVRLTSLGEPGARRLNDLERAPLLRRLAQLEIPLSFFGNSSQMDNLIVALRDLACERGGLGDLKVLLNHLGAPADGLVADRHGRPRLLRGLGPDSLARIEHLARFTGVRVALSGCYALSRESSPHNDLRPALERILNAYGPKRVLWGSDFPWIDNVPGYSATLGLVDQLLPGLASDERDAIRGRNAMDLFRLQPPVTPHNDPGGTRR